MRRAQFLEYLTTADAEQAEDWQIEGLAAAASIRDLSVRGYIRLRAVMDAETEEDTQTVARPGAPADQKRSLGRPLGGENR